MRKATAVSSLLAVAAHATTTTSQEPTTTLTMSGTHHSNTSDGYGNFRHPFLGESPDVASIFYPESKTFSIKLTPYDSQASMAAGNSHHLLKDSYKSNLTNTSNTKYLATLYVGTPLQAINGIYWSTRTGQLMIETQGCSTCQGSLFQKNDSSTFNYKSPDEPVSTTFRDNSVLSGKMATEKVCPVNENKSCSNNFEFVAVDSQSGWTTAETGIIGLWRGDAKASSFASDLYVPWLHSTGKIDEPTFSFFLTDTSAQSYIEFGEPNESIVGDGDKVIWLPVNEDRKEWSNFVKGFKWDDSMKDTVDNLEVTYASKPAFTDLGAGCIVGPSNYISDITSKVLARASDVKTDNAGNTSFACTSKSSLPAFYLNFGGYWFEVPADDYVVLASTANNDYCQLCLTSNTASDDEWTLGATFMRDWYTMHDYKNNRFGFVPIPGSSKSTPKAVPNEEESSLHAQISIGVAMVFSVAVWGYFAYVFCFSTLAKQGNSTTVKKGKVAVSDTNDEPIVVLLS